MKKIAVLVSALALLVMLAAIAPAFAKDMHMPEGASDVYYMDGEGNAVVDIPSGGIPAKPTATKMFIGVHIDAAPAKYFGVRLYIMLWEIAPFATEYSWQPWVEVTTNAESAALLRQFWGGCATEFNLAASVFYCQLLQIDTSYAPLLTTDNVFVVSDEQLTAERHGNNVVVNLAVPLQIKVPLTVADYWTLPAFSFKLDAYGGSVHSEETTVMSGYPGAWGGTLTVDKMGFNARGTFTCPAWSYSSVPTSNGWVTMNGKQVFYPPP